ncbi:small ubiquitin-related modifier 1-like isoform X2 [Primulina huaijiensis]|uniref:small ubiquitin-related modifier 1-like isoform X2 n=1 Tax=Primulina huaijiensis TaxID=1492673 RepID=UPI003CC72F9D
MSTPRQEEEKNPSDSSVAMNLKVKDQDGNERVLRIKRNTQLKKLMNEFCGRKSLDLNSFTFLFEGRRIRGEQTPDELDLEDGDEIDVMIGGARA